VDTNKAAIDSLEPLTEIVNDINRHTGDNTSSILTLENGSAAAAA